MGKVHILDSTIANRIAAGEVVERPSGVVKELVENAIDAKSTRIEISIKEGGISEIEVIDNGVGMDREDATLAFERHATSKIINENDLWNIHTLGFRGEALPSIASVSEVELFSCNGVESTHISINNGKIECIESAAMRKGTQIIVRNLFYTIPARLKHLKTPQYETSQILDIVQKLALGNPSIAFILRSDSKEIFRSSGNGDLSAVLYTMYGRDVANAAVEVHVSDDDFQVDGLVCLPTQTRSSRKSILFFMNNRIVISYYLQAAIMNAYEEYLPEKRFPMVFLNISMDSHLVDVNVHPSKWEVRLSKEKQLFALIEKGVKEAIFADMNKQASLISSSELEKPTKKKEQYFEQSLFSEYKDTDAIKKDYSYLFSSIKEENMLETNVINNENVEKHVVDVGNNTEIVEKTANGNDFAFIESAEKEQIVSNFVTSVEKNDEYVDKNEENVEKITDIVENNVDTIVEPLDSKAVSLPDAEIIPFEVIGQLHGSYILASNNDGLVIIDQHAANERIRYEKVKKLLENEQVELQQLLIPLVISLNKTAMYELERIKEGLMHVGIDIDSFGDNEIIVREIPTWMNDINDESSYIVDLIDAIIADKKLELASLKKHVLATLACHSSIRFNRNLSKLEMEETIKSLFKCENPYHCPHGRPTYIVYENSKLRKLFERG